MNISLFKKINRYQNYYQFLYGLLIINIMVVVTLLLLFLKNKTILKYDGIISDNNILVLSNLSSYDANLITNSLDIKIDDDSIKYKVLDYQEIRGSYTLKMSIDKYYLDSRSVEIEVLLKEENLGEFILKTMKGE